MELKNPLNCCGIWELSGFTEGVEKAKADMTRLILTVNATAHADYKGGQGCGIIIATLTPRQQPTYTKLLEDYGFTKTWEFHNPRSGNDLITFSIKGKDAYKIASKIKVPKTKVQHRVRGSDFYCSKCAAVIPGIKVYEQDGHYDMHDQWVVNYHHDTYE